MLEQSTVSDPLDLRIESVCQDVGVHVLSVELCST